jgi:hypothetical protein
VSNGRKLLYTHRYSRFNPVPENVLRRDVATVTILSGKKNVNDLIVAAILPSKINRGR